MLTTSELVLAVATGLVAQIAGICELRKRSVAWGLVIAGSIAAAGTANVNSVAYAQTAQGQIGFADIVDRVRPSVISVRVKLDASPHVTDPQDTPLNRFLDRFLPEYAHPKSPPPGHVTTGQGSGFFISADGYAVTNNHVVENAESVRVTTDDGTTYTAKVVGTDPRTDLALIKVDGRAGLPYAKFAEAEPRVGDWVLAVGNPFGLGGTVTAGIVSARGREIGNGPYDDFIQIDAPVNKGNSGGPSFNINGSVIGVNTAIISPSDGSVGIALAIPAETVKAVITQLKNKGTVTRGYIGVRTQNITADIADYLGLKGTRGALVVQPLPDGPAVKVGIQAEDVVTAINDYEVKDTRDFAWTISNMSPGASAKVTIIRNGDEKLINVILAELPRSFMASVTPTLQVPSGANMAGLGLAVGPHEPGGGVVVTDIDPNGVAAENGFNAGDVILGVSGKKISTLSDYFSAIQAAQKNGKRIMLMRVISAGELIYLTLPVGQG